LVIAVALPWMGLACGRSSEGQENGRDAELERKVEELMPQIEGLAGLQAKQTPAVRRASAETLETYLLSRLDSEYPGDTLENLAEAYRAFGLIPDTVDIRRLLVDLLLEQAIGYYDPARNVLFIRDEASGVMLDAVIVHELVHALQDQHADLDSLTHAVTSNDARSAIQAAVEGHATVAMFAQQLSVTTGAPTSIDQLPELGPEMAAAMADPSQFPLLAQAPAIVRDPLLFAYLGGARYIQRLWKTQPGTPSPLGEWLPESTEQLLHTDRILSERDRPTPLTISGLPRGWELVYGWDLGELEMTIFFEEHLGDRRLAAAAAAGWDGDAYVLLARGGDQALVWYSVWDTEADADEFAEAYRAVFAARFGGAGPGPVFTGGDRQARIERLTVSGRAAVRVVESRRGLELDAVPEAVAGRGGR
jgi:hypothetical protein